MNQSTTQFAVPRNIADTLINATTAALTHLRNSDSGGKETADLIRKLSDALDQHHRDQQEQHQLAPYIDAARDLALLQDGTLEVDADARTSESDDGAYVSAWLWVDKPD